MNQSLSIASPWLNAAGSLGFAPDAHGPINLNSLSAFVTNPISLRPRRAATPPRMQKHALGILLHSGHPNPGFSKALRQFRAKWARAPLPIIVNLLAEHPDDLRRMLPPLEEIDNVIAVEVGLPPDSDAGLAADLTRAALGELPIFGLVAANRMLELAPVMIKAGASAVSLGAPRAEVERAAGGIFNGRLYGPRVFEGTLNITQKLVALGIPAIASGGIYHPEQGQALLAAGALAVQLDTVLWKGETIQVEPGN